MIGGRVIQGAGGGIFPLAFSIIRDEFPRERVPGAIGLVSSLLGIGGGAGVVFAGIVTENLSYHWLFLVPAGDHRLDRISDMALHPRVARQDAG
jgi:MFS family permease